MQFHQLPIGCTFLCNGNLCRKQSPRTAMLVYYGRVFYFGLKESVSIALEF